MTGRDRPSSPAAAFTLVGMLLTMVIGSIILLAAISVLGSAANSYDRGSSGMAAEREARAVLTQMANDLANSVWNTNTMLEKGSGKGWPQAKLGLFALQSDDAQSDAGRIGDLCATGYRLKDITVGGANVRCLMRSFRESQTTFTALKAGITDSLFTPDDQDEPVAFGVIGFEITPLTRSANGKWQEWSKNSGASGSTTPDDTGTTVTGPTGPDAVKIRLIIARKELIGKLKSPNDWSGSPLLGSVAEPERNPNLEVYEVIQRFGNPG